MKIATSRLDLAPATVEHLDAELEHPERLGEILNASVGPGWPPGEYDRDAQVFFRAKLLEGGQAVASWYTWYVILRNAPGLGPVLVGAAGFFGPPNELHEVEIGFSILPVWEGRGLATELVMALVQHAFADSRVTKVCARTTPKNLASQRVLRKAGFVCVNEGEDTNVLRFEVLN